MKNDEWFFTKSIYKNSKGIGFIPLKKGYSNRNVISASFKSPEVVIKIPRRNGNSKGLIGIKNHWNYISRNGKLDIETNFGDKIKGKKAINLLLNDWKVLGIPKISNRREALNIVLSMPPGTDGKSLLNSVREFAQEQFHMHQYVFALHTDELHPHVHLCLMIKNCFGKRLNPRKADIQEWRIRFADNLRENGIACSATYRQHRGIYQKKANGIIKQIKKRGGISTVEIAKKRNLDFYIENNIMPPTPFLNKAKTTRAKIIENYIKFANSLYEEGDLKNYNAIVNFIKDINDNPFISKAKEKYLSHKNISLDQNMDI